MWKVKLEIKSNKIIYKVYNPADDLQAVFNKAEKAEKYIKSKAFI